MKLFQAAPLAALIAALTLIGPAHAQTPSLGSAQNFAVLGATTVTNTGASAVSGNLGVSPGTAITGFPPGTMPRGVIYAGGSVATQAASDLATAYADVAGRAYLPANDLSGRDLGGLRLAPGVYHFNTAAQLSSTLTLDAKGDANAVFIFQIGTTFTAASNASVKLIGGGSSDNVYWQVGSSATVGTGAVLQGNILAYTSITLTTNASVLGRLLAKNGAVTLDTNRVANGHWTAASIAAVSDGVTRVLWYRTDGAVSYWTVDAAGNYADSHAYGPFPDWTARHIAVGPNHLTRILWTNKDGRMTLWNVDANGAFTNTPAFGPFAGWTATDLAVGPDNRARVLWANVDGRVTLWSVGSDSSFTNTPAYGPYSGWTAKNLSIGPNGVARLLWNHDDGRASLWAIDSSDAVTTSVVYGPFAGWGTAGFSVGPNNAANILWNNADGGMAIWAIQLSGAQSSSPVYGPFAGWCSTALSFDGAGTAHVLWNNSDARASTWSINSVWATTYGAAYGPYTN